MCSLTRICGVINVSRTVLGVCVYVHPVLNWVSNAIIDALCEISVNFVKRVVFFCTGHGTCFWHLGLRVIGHACGFGLICQWVWCLFFVLCASPPRQTAFLLDRPSPRLRASVLQRKRGAAPGLVRVSWGRRLGTSSPPPL